MISCLGSNKYVILVLALICLLVPADGAPGRHTNSPETPGSGRLGQEIERLNTLLRAHPHDMETLIARAGLYSDAGEKQLAINDFTMAINYLTVNDTAGLMRHQGLSMRRAECFEALKQYQLAARDVKVFLSSPPRPVYRYGEAVRIFLEAGEYKDSVGCADTYISATQIHSSAYASRAIALAFLDEDEKAVADLSDALRLKFGIKDLNPSPGSNSICTQEVIDMCLSRFALVARANKKKQTALLGKGLVESLATHFDQAVADSTAALALSPSFYEAFLVRGLCHLSLKQNKDAFKDINQAIMLRPTDALGYKILELYYLASSNVDELLSDLTKREQEQPGNLIVLMAEAHGQKVSRDVDKERMTYERILKQNPKFAPALFARGELSQGLGDLHSAVQYFSGGLVEDPNYLTGLKARAACYLELGDYARALIDLNKVIKICADPNAYTAREQCSIKLRIKNRTGNLPN
jgi:tetratricopeptide (TPR) repeat protein